MRYFAFAVRALVMAFTADHSLDVRVAVAITNRVCYRPTARFRSTEFLRPRAAVVDQDHGFRMLPNPNQPLPFSPLPVRLRWVHNWQDRLPPNRCEGPPAFQT